MSHFIGLVRALVLFLAVGGFLFGQIFVGAFSVGGTLAGIGGLLAGVPGGSGSRPTMRRAALAGSVVGVAGAALHVIEYYATAQMSGNYYPWFLTLPYCGGLLLIAWRLRNAQDLDSPYQA